MKESLLARENQPVLVSLNLFCIQFMINYTHSHCIDVGEAQDFDSSKDKSYNNSDCGDILLGSNNTIDEEVLEDIKEDAAIMPTPKSCKSKPPISAKKAAPISSIEQLATDFDSVSLTAKKSSSQASPSNAPMFHTITRKIKACHLV